MAAPTVRSFAVRSSGPGNSGTIVIPKPAGTTAGDLLLTYFHATAVAAVATITLPTGWTLYQRNNSTLNFSATVEVWAYRVAGGSEPTSYTFTSDDAGNWAGQIVALINATAPPEAFGRSLYAVNNNQVPHPSVTTLGPDRLIVLGVYDAEYGHTPPAGFTETAEDDNGNSGRILSLATKAQSAAGATGTLVTTRSSTGAEDRVGWTVSIPGTTPAVVADPPGISIAFTDNWDVASPTWTRIDNVAGRRVRGYTIDRGRPNEFEKTGTGTATIRIADTVGTFDPTDPVAATTVAPGKQANISLWNPVNSTWHTIFRGYVESWRYVLDQTRQYTEVELTLTDGFAILSRYELVPLVDGALPPYTGTPDKVKLADFAKGNVLYGETTGTVGDRLLAILADAGWPAALATNWVSPPAGTIPDVFSGNVRLGPKAYAPGTSALDALFDAADGEFPGVANLYMSANGHVRFRGRQARFRPAVAQYGITPWLVGDPSAWTDATCVPLAELEWSHGEDNLYNSCTATPQGVGSGTAWRPYNPDPPDNDNPATQTATAPTSIAVHGLRGLTFDNLQTIEGKATGNNSKVETALFASYYVQNYAAPNPRISRAVFKTRRPANTHAGKLWEFLCNVEISDLLTVKTDHPGAGGFSADFFVEGLHYTVRPGPPEHAIVELSLDISPRAHWTTNPFSTDPDPA